MPKGLKKPILALIDFIHMNASTLKVYELFKEKWGKEEASMVINYLGSSTQEKIKAEIKPKIEHLATKEDLKDSIHEHREEVLKLESSLREEILKSESSLREEILKLETAMSKKHFDIIKWMFIFWVGAVGTIIAAMIAIVKYLTG